MQKLDKNFLENIEKMFFPAVFLLVNEEQKLVWISRTNCLAEGILRTIKQISEGTHSIDKIDGWELLYKHSGKKLLYEYSRVCQEYSELGYKVLSRKIQYKIKKRLKISEYGIYTTLVVLGTRNYDIKILGEFKTIKEADEFISQWEKRI